MKNNFPLRSILISGIVFLSVISSSLISIAAERAYSNPTGKEFPIMAYHAFWPNMINNENYRVLRECGFNMANGYCADTTFISKSLKYAENNQIKVIVNCPSTRNADRLHSTMQRYNDYPATAGYYLFDEPVLKQFESAAELINIVVKYNPHKLAYVNLLPNYARKDIYGTSDYRSYLQKFIETASPQFLSYDNYCILEKNGRLTLRPNYYENLEVAREVCNKNNLPLWTFCLSTSHFDYPVPNEAQLLFEAFSGLAYGSKAIQYYGYATSYITQGDTLYTAPVDQQGRRRKVWYAVQKANRQIQTVGQLLLPCKSVGVWHTGSQIPSGTHALKRGDLPSPFYSIVSESAGVVVSHHTDGTDNYLLIVNKDFQHKQKVRVDKNSNVRRIDMNGKVIVDNTRQITLKPGSWCMYKW